MKKKINIEQILFLASICVSLLLILAIFSILTSNADYINIFFNSDTLYLPSLYKDLIQEHNGLKGWYLSGAPNFFPDMIFYFIIMFFTNNFIVSSFLFPVFQYIALLFLIKRVFQLIIPNYSYLFASLANLLMMLFFFVTLCSNDFGFTFYLLSNSFHTGAFIMAFLCLIISLNYLKSAKRLNLIILFFICTLCILSDRLFIILFSIPIFSIIIFLKDILYRKKIITLLITNISGLILGLFIFKSIRSGSYITIPPPHRMMDFNNIIPSYKILKDQMGVYITNLNFQTIIIIGSIISLLIIIFIFFSNLKKEKPLSIFTLYCFISIAYILIVFLTPVLSGSYTGWDIQRYNIYAFYISIINIGVITAYYFNKFHNNKLFLKIIMSIIIVSLAFSSYIGYKQFSISGLNNYFSFYPERVKCIDELSKKEKLSCGVAEYWTAKYTTMFSKNNVKVYAVHDDLIPYHHVTNSNWFYNKNAIFNFIILNNFSDREAFKRKIGNNYIKIDSECVDVIKVPEFKYCPNPLDLYLTDSLKGK